MLLQSDVPPRSFTSKRAVSPNPYLDNPVNGYACPTGMALHYDDVPINGTVRTEPRLASFVQTLSLYVLVIHMCSKRSLSYQMLQLMLG